MNRQRVSDIITINDVKQWKIDDMVLITAPTGAGKSHFIKNTLYNYCKENNKTILYLTNRNILKDQFLQEIEENKKTDIIKIMNYQKIEKDLIRELKPEQYDFVIADECHYIFTDACFNRNTDLTIEWLINASSTIKILLSATSDLILTYLESHRKIKLRKKYYIQHSTNHINNLYFYHSDNVLKKLLFDLPEGEKAIYFCSAKKAYETYQEIKEAEFICSKNSRYYNHSNRELKKQIVEEEKFDCKILCSTTVLDNGVNIKDKDVKHIIVDYLDLDTIIQCIGRKRIIDDKDKINIYIKDRGKRSLNYSLLNFNNNIEQGKYLKENGNIKFVKKYGREPLRNIVYLTTDGAIPIDVRFNEIMHIKYLTDISSIELMLNVGYDFIVCQRLNFDITNTRTLEDEYDNLTLTDKLNKMVGLKMFEEEQKNFKDFLLSALFNAPKDNHGSLGLKVINGLFIDNNLSFTIKSEKENSRKSNNRGKHYWIIEKDN